MAWYGVNFVLGTGLHSYGFGQGGVEYVLGFHHPASCFHVFRLEKRKRGLDRPLRLFDFYQKQRSCQVKGCPQQKISFKNGEYSKFSSGGGFLHEANLAILEPLLWKNLSGARCKAV